MDKKFKKIIMLLLTITLSFICLACDKNAGAPSNPSEPSIPSTPSNPSEPSIPSTPSNPSEPSNPEVSVHVHAFAQLAGNQSILFCSECNGYLVKGVNSEYLEVDENPQTLEYVLSDENVQPINGKMNFIISGSVEYDATYTISSVTYVYNLNKSDSSEVNISGCGTNPELTLVTGDTTYADGAEFRAGYQEGGIPTAKISMVGIKLNDTRNTSTSHYTLTNTEFTCDELYLEDCTFTNCIDFSEGTKITIKNCVFDFQVSSRYSVWVGYVGANPSGAAHDRVESCIIQNCTFNNTKRGIKILTSGANIIIEENTFVGLTEKPAIVLDSTNVELNTVLIKNNTFTDCTKGSWNSLDNSNYNEPYNTDCFAVTEQ